jgi:hypothetical protein
MKGKGKKFIEGRIKTARNGNKGGLTTSRKEEEIGIGCILSHMFHILPVLFCIIVYMVVFLYASV